jgi:hypothetical protein
MNLITGFKFECLIKFVTEAVPADWLELAVSDA